MDVWEQLKSHTQARIGLGRSGHSLSTRDLLDFQVAHALAKDAVHERWDVALFLEKMKKLGEKPLLVKTAVFIREQYLKYPGLGRVLCPASREKLEKLGKKRPVDIVFTITDGLSSLAITTHMLPFWKVLRPMIDEAFPKLKVALIVAPYGRVALSDDVGKALGARLSVIFVGERPGLSSVDSLGIYLTYAPKPGNTDARRNCISNVHPPEGLAYPIAAEKLLFLMEESLRLKLSGVGLKEEVHHLPEHFQSRLGLGL